MDYTTRLDEKGQAHVNYKCPCGCEAGLIYEREHGAQHLGQCCCGRLLWVGEDAEAMVRSHYQDGVEYDVELSNVVLPWGEEQTVALGVPQPAVAREQAKRAAGKVPTKVVDPVCGMMFDPDDAADTSAYRGSVYYFCASACRTKFDARPSRYVKSSFLASLRWRIVGG